MAVLPGRHVPAYVRESYPSFFIENKRPNLLFFFFSLKDSLRPHKSCER